MPGLPGPGKPIVEAGVAKDKKGNWWATYFGNDNQSPWREKPGIVKIDFDEEGKIGVAKGYFSLKKL